VLSQVTSYSVAILAILLAESLFEVLFFSTDNKTMGVKDKYRQKNEQPPGIHQQSYTQINHGPGDIHWISAEPVGTRIHNSVWTTNIHILDGDDRPSYKEATEQEERPSKNVFKPRDFKELERQP
jgi:hypothetical protein